MIGILVWKLFVGPIRTYWSETDFWSLDKVAIICCCFWLDAASFWRKSFVIYFVVGLEG